MSATPFCPATMCPLTAPNGSPWTGQKNARCDGPKCGWWHDAPQSHCGACGDAEYQAEYAIAHKNTGGIIPVVALSRKFKVEIKPHEFDCPRAAECQWQTQAGEKLCPPRMALQAGLDPQVCLF